MDQITPSAPITATTPVQAPVQASEETEDFSIESNSSEIIDSVSNAFDSPAVAMPTDEFSKMVIQRLGTDGQNEVNEEELFAALIGAKLEKLSPEAAQFYEQKRAELASATARSDGYVYVENVAVAALKETVAAGHLDLKMAEQINGEAFLAAQLDDNHEALFDGRGSEGDPSIATSAMEAALLAMRTTIESFESGAAVAESRSLNTPSTGPQGSSIVIPLSTAAQTLTSSSSLPTEDLGSVDDVPISSDAATLIGPQSLDGDEGFLWKAESETDGNLIVLLPSELRGLISRVEIHSSLPPDESTKLAEGNFTQDTENGMRPHYRFDKFGGEYGEQAYLVAYRNDGEVVSWFIEDTGERND